MFFFFYREIIHPHSWPWLNSIQVFVMVIMAELARSISWMAHDPNEDLGLKQRVREIAGVFHVSSRVFCFYIPEMVMTNIAMV